MPDSMEQKIILEPVFDVVIPTRPLTKSEMAGLQRSYGPVPDIYRAALRGEPCGADPQKLDDEAERIYRSFTKSFALQGMR